MQWARRIVASFVFADTPAPSFLTKALAAAVFLSLLPASEALAGAPVASGKQLEAPRFLETVQGRVVAGRGVAVGPRGGAVARRGYVARGPGGGVVAGGGYVARGPRGNVVAGRGAAVAGPGYRPVPVQPWARPASYWWHPGMAVVSGAAIGFVTAAAATTYANSRAPAPGYCWYYTNPQRTQGFWDACP